MTGRRPALNLLLDTHVWVWTQEAPDRLGPMTREAILDPANEVQVSATSSLEIARLIALGRLGLKMDLQSWVVESIRLLQGVTLEITHQIAIEAYSIPEPFHRDPADRLLVATARIHASRLVTADDPILSYPHVPTLDARD